VLLPGHPYDGDDPDGFMSREEVVGYLERYSRGFRAPVQEGIEVTSLRPRSGCFALKTSAGELEAPTVVLCTGAYQGPYRPAVAATLPPELLQIDVEDYRNPEALPPGGVLVVGSGQSGCQLAEELHEAGREVFLSCGRAGYDLHYRTLQALGVTLVGRFRGVEGRHALFAADLPESVAWGDQRHEQFMDRIRKLAAERGLRRVDTPGVDPFHCEAPERLDLRGIGVVVFTGGFRPDYESWVHCPSAFDELGFPIQEDGASSVIHGMYFVGVHFLRKRKSSLLTGVGEDAALVAQKIAGERASPTG
jgi:putative flavoprotein involved in K+ transport